LNNGGTWACDMAFMTVLRCVMMVHIDVLLSFPITLICVKILYLNNPPLYICFWSP
jgi:hypothetical protein